MYVDTWMLQKRAQLELLLQLQAVQPKAAAHRRNRANSLYSHPTHSQLDLALQIDLAKRSNSISTRSPPRSSYNTVMRHANSSSHLRLVRCLLPVATATSYVSGTLVCLSAPCSPG